MKEHITELNIDTTKTEKFDEGLTTIQVNTELGSMCNIPYNSILIDSSNTLPLTEMYFRKRILELIEEAEKNGFVITVSQEQHPNKPLKMGNYRTVFDVRNKQYY